MEAAVPAAYEPTGNDRPSTAATVRVIAIPCALLVLGAVSLVFGWVVAGIVACIFAVLVVLGEIAVGWVVVKYALRRHANMFRLLASLLKDEPSAPHSRVKRPSDSAAEQLERTIDRAVGFGLARMSAEGGFFAGARTQREADALRDHTLSERATTYSWLQSAPDWENVSTVSDDGTELVAHMLVADAASSRWAVLCHGYAGSWDSMLQYARHWAQAGYSLLVPSMRGHGDSGGAFVGTGWLDRRDVVAWARWLVSEQGDCPIVLFGHSMGASSVCMAAGEPDLPAQVRAVVSDCAFDSSWHALSSVLELCGAPVHPTLDLARLYLMAQRGGYDLAMGDVASALGRVSLPVLFVHGSSDPIVSPALAPRLLQSAGGNRKDILMVAGAGHCQSSLADPELYWSRVLGFADEFVS